MLSQSERTFPTPKTLITSAIYALSCTVGNWHYSSFTQAETWSQTIDISGATLFVLLSSILIFVCGRRLYRNTRFLLDTSTRIPITTKFIDLRPCIFLLPMLVHYSSGTSSSSTARTEGYSFGYGSDASWLAIITVTACIILFQLSSGTRAFKIQTEQGAAANP